MATMVGKWAGIVNDCSAQFRTLIKERVYQAAFVFLVLFAVMVIYNDLMKTIPGLADRLP